jgi:branched-chain amino acid transport system substrate-binding protein
MNRLNLRRTRSGGMLLVTCLALGSGSTRAQDIVIGQVLSMTGPASQTAQELARGRLACVEWLNEQGGVRGRRMKVVTRDDRGEPARAVSLAQELADREAAVVLFGAMGPEVNSALLAWAAKGGMAVIGPHGGDVEVRAPGSETAFFLTANQSAEAQKIASHVTSLGLTRMVIVHANDRSGTAALTAFEEGLGVAGASAMAVVLSQPDGSDAAKTAGAVLRHQPQAVLLATSGRATAAILKALAAAEFPLLQVYGLSSAASPADLLALGSKARGFSMSQVVPSPRDSSVAVVRSFRQALKSVAGERTPAELEGCLGPLVLAEVLRRKPVDATRAAVLRALATAGRVELGGFDVDLSDRTHRGSRFTDIVHVGSDGRVAR